MVYYGQRYGGDGSSLRPANGFKEAANSVEFLGKKMLGMQLRAAKPDTDDERVGFYHSLISIWLKLV
jgi:glycogen synthase kinase 3 beta